MRFKIEEESKLLVPVSVGVSTPRKRALESSLEPVPANTRGMALIDTGASISVVYRQIITKLKLTPRGLCRVYGFSGSDPDNIEHPNYDISLAILDAVHHDQKPRDEVDRIEFPALQAVSPPFTSSHHDMLIGMDVLSSMVLTVNWPDKWFDLNRS
ncbi:MAG: hypothetical protein AAGA96_20640 [Verrucomicrobiota bacterium]